ncbi:hypothetical protein Tco_0513630 [Tanacetum coccineum]
MTSSSPICLMKRDTSTNSWLWHRRLSRLNFDTINKLAKDSPMIGVPNFKYTKNNLFPSHEQGKSKKATYKPKIISSTEHKLHMLHRDLYGPMRVESINEKKHILLKAKGDIGFFIGSFKHGHDYWVYDRRTRRVMETMNVKFDELSAMASEQRNLMLALQQMASKTHNLEPALNHQTSGHISSGLGYRQEEGIDLEESSALMARIEVTEKALYGLKQDPRVWLPRYAKEHVKETGLHYNADN